MLLDLVENVPSMPLQSLVSELWTNLTCFQGRHVSREMALEVIVIPSFEVAKKDKELDLVIPGRSTKHENNQNSDMYFP